MSRPSFEEVHRLSGRAANGPAPRGKLPTRRQKEKAFLVAKARLAELMTQNNTAALDLEDWHALIDDLRNEWDVKAVMER